MPAAEADEVLRGQPGEGDGDEQGHAVERGVPTLLGADHAEQQHRAGGGLERARRPHQPTGATEEVRRLGDATGDDGDHDLRDRQLETQPHRADGDDREDRERQVDARVANARSDDLHTTRADPQPVGTGSRDERSRCARFRRRGSCGLHEPPSSSASSGGRPPRQLDPSIIYDRAGRRQRRPPARWRRSDCGALTRADQILYDFPVDGYRRRASGGNRPLRRGSRQGRGAECPRAAGPKSHRRLAAPAAACTRRSGGRCSAPASSRSGWPSARCSSCAASSPPRPCRRPRGARCCPPGASSRSSPSARWLVIMMGGIDLSMGATISLLANVLVGVAKGQDDRLPQAILVVLSSASSSGSSTVCWSPCSSSTR